MFTLRLGLVPSLGWTFIRELILHPSNHFFGFYGFLTDISDVCCVVIIPPFSHVQLFVTTWTAARQASLSFTIAHTYVHWVGDAIQSSVAPFSSCPQSFPASGFLPLNRLFTSCGQSVGASAVASVLPTNTQDWFSLGWTGWISLQSKGLSSLLQHHSWRASILWHSAFFTVQLSHPYISDLGSFLHCPLRRELAFKTLFIIFHFSLP